MGQSIVLDEVALARDPSDGDEGLSLGDMAALVGQRWRLIVGSSLAAGLITLGVTFLIPPTFTARTSFLPPQQSQGGAAAAALNNLGALAGLIGGAANIKTPADQYVALMQSVFVSDHIIDAFALMGVYESKFRVDARKELASNVRITVGKKDGLMTVEVDDESPQRSAAMANSYITELRSLTTTLAVSEAQQRRVFFEQQLQATKAKLTQAQIALQGTGINAGAIKAEPKAVAEGYAKVRAELAASEVRLQTMRGMLADHAPEIIQQQALIDALRRQLATLEVGVTSGSKAFAAGDADYIGRYREFKYQETLFELFARQYELARIDESREGALVQVLDVATVPEKKSRPKRALIALSVALIVCLFSSLVVVLRQFRRQSLQS